LHKISSYLALCWLWVVITFEIEDPKSIQMRMNGHMEGVRLLAIYISWTLSIPSFAIAWVATKCITKKDEQQANSNDSPH